MRVVKNGTQFARVGEPVRFAVLSAIPEEIVSVCFSMKKYGHWPFIHGAHVDPPQLGSKLKSSRNRLLPSYKQYLPLSKQL